LADARYRSYVLTVLTAVYTLSFMDRSALGLLMQDIKEELVLSDTQLGFLTGVAFALFYATAGLPLARWADRGDRVTVVAFSIGLWGVMVALTSAVANFAQILMVRIGAAVGEAGCFPPSSSLLGDYYPVAQRIRALSIYMMGISFNVVISLMVAGWVSELYGWRTAFLVIGLPGLAMSILVIATVRDPRRHRQGSGARAHRASPPPVGSVLSILWRQRTYRRILVATTLANFVGIGLSQWYASFFIRSHQAATGELGLWMGLAGGLGGAVGTYGGGYLAERFLADNPRGQTRLIALCVALIFPFTVLMLCVPTKTAALVMLVPVYMCSLAIYGPVVALLQRLVDERIRAVALAVFLFALNLVGMGLGPQAIGILSDLLNSTLGSDALRVAMLAASAVILLAAYGFFLAGRDVEVDLAAAETRPATSTRTDPEDGDGGAVESAGPRQGGIGRTVLR